jgi:hypothetical protein
LPFSLLCYTCADFTIPEACSSQTALGILSNVLDSVLPVVVIFVLEISGLRQLCCRFFSSLWFPTADLAASSLLPVCSLSEQRESKQIVYFLILTSTTKQGIGSQVYQNQSVRRVLQKQGGVFPAEQKKAPQSDKPSGVSTFLIVVLAL